MLQRFRNRFKGFLKAYLAVCVDDAIIYFTEDYGFIDRSYAFIDRVHDSIVGARYFIFDALHALRNELNHDFLEPCRCSVCLSKYEKDDSYEKSRVECIQDLYEHGYLTHDEALDRLRRDVN